MFRSSSYSLEASTAAPARLNASFWLVLAALWALAHPWIGLYHDGVLYAGQALANVRPEVFREDLFFRFGSQDDYTIFGRLYGATVGIVGLNGASRLLWGVSQLLWLVVAIAWIRRAAARQHLLLVAAAVIAQPAFYGSDTVFRVAESFLTARSFAEPLALGGILLVWLRQCWLGGAALAFAMLIHPIIALPALLVAGVLAFCEVPESRRRHLAMVLFVGTVLGLIVLLTSGPLERIDDEWYAFLVVKSPYLLPDQWGSVDWTRMVFPALVLALVAPHAYPRWRRVWVVVAACATMGLIMAVSAWVLRWELGLQAQFWRFGWLACWMAPLAALQLAASLPAGDARRIVLAAVIPACALMVQDWWPLAWWLPLLCLVFLAASLADAVRYGVLGRFATIAMAGLLGFAALAGGLLAVLAVVIDPGSNGHAYDGSVRATAATYLGWIALPVVAWIGGRLSDVCRFPNIDRLFAVALATIAVLGLDARSVRAVTLDRLVDEGLPRWVAVVAPDARVLWPDHMPRVWFAMGRQSYASRAQLSGAVFNREMALEGSRRMANIRSIAGRDGVAGFHETGPIEAPAPTLDALRAACADPMLDFVVLPIALAPLVAPPYVDPATAKAFHLHRCADLRTP